MNQIRLLYLKEKANIVLLNFIYELYDLRLVQVHLCFIENIQSI